MPATVLSRNYVEGLGGGRRGAYDTILNSV